MRTISTETRLAPRPRAVRPAVASPAAESRGPELSTVRSRQILVALVLAMILALAWTAPAAADPPRTVTVIDEADHVTDPDHLESQAEQLDFRSEVRLVLLSIDVTEYGRPRHDDRALNDAVLLHAREMHPDWIDGDVWADGLVIIAIDQDNRFVGTYAGEDVKLSNGGYEDVQEEMKDAARNGNTRGALMEGAERYATLMHRPFWLAPVPLAVIGTAAGFSLLFGAFQLSTTRTARRELAEGRERLRELEVQESQVRSAVRALPEDSYYAGLLRELAEKRSEALRTADEVDSSEPARIGILWGTSAEQREHAKSIDRSTTEARGSTALLLSGSDLLARRGDWSRQWTAEIRPLQNAVARIEEEFAPYGWVEFEDHDDPDTLQAQEALRSAAAEVDAQLPGIEDRVRSGALSTSEALEELDELTEGLSAAVLDYVSARIAGNAKDEDEEQMMHAASRAALREVTGEGTPRSVRALSLPNTSEIDPSADRSSHRLLRTAWATGLDPLGFLGTWRIDGPQYLREHRARITSASSSSDSSSSSTSGFSTSSFGGSGSSSRF